MTKTCTASSIIYSTQHTLVRIRVVQHTAYCTRVHQTKLKKTGILSPSSKSVVKMSRRYPLFWWNVVAKIRKGRFGTMLGLTPEELRVGGTLRVEHVGGDESVVSVEVPRWCCSASDGRLRLSAVLGIMDEASTYAGICVWDQGHRPGVSIQLEGRATHPQGFIDTGAGERINIRTTKVKAGKTITFLKASIERGTNVLAQCSHIKFMPMGFPLDHIFHPKVKNVSMPLVERITRKIPLHDHAMPESIDDILGLTDSTSSAATKAYSILVSEIHGNPMGSIHGGASVMLAELAAEKRMPQICPDNTVRPIRIKSNLLNGIDCSSRQVAEIDITVGDRSGIQESNNTMHTTSTVRNNGQMCSDTLIEWA